MAPTSGVEKLARPEVGNLYPQGVIQENILGLQVPDEAHKNCSCSTHGLGGRSGGGRGRGGRSAAHLWMTPFECMYPSASTIWAA